MPESTVWRTLSQTATAIGLELMLGGMKPWITTHLASYEPELCMIPHGGTPRCECDLLCHPWN